MGLYKLSYYSFLALVNEEGKASKVYTDGACIDKAYINGACPGRVYIDGTYADGASTDRAIVKRK